MKEIWKNKKKRSITILVAIWLVILTLAGTFAWFTSRTNTDVPVVLGSACRLNVTNTFTDLTVMPGDIMEGEISFTSLSTRNDFIRIKIDVVNPESFFIGDDTFDDLFELETNTNLVRHGNWLYVPGPFNPGEQLTVLENITVRGREFSPEYQNRSLQIRVTFDCVQGTEAAVRDLWVREGGGVNYLTEREAGRLGYIEYWYTLTVTHGLGNISTHRLQAGERMGVHYGGVPSGMRFINFTRDAPLSEGGTIISSDGWFMFTMPDDDAYLFVNYVPL